MKGVTLRKYSRKQYVQRDKNYRALSLPIHLAVKFSNIMKRSIDSFYTDMVADYRLDLVCLKLCIKDIHELQQAFSSGDKQEEQIL